MTTYTLQLSDAELARYRWMAARARDSERALWDAAGISAGARIADVGCGPGAVLALLAEAVGPTGHVVGVDADEQAVAAAAFQLAAAGLPNADVRVGQADSSGLEPATFDVVLLRHVLAHNGGQEQAIVDHLASLARPGGVVYLVDVDISAAGMIPPAPDLADLLDRYVTLHRCRGNDPRIGLRLRDLARAAGLAVIDYRGWFEISAPPRGVRPPPWAARRAMVAAGLATDDDVRRWDAALERLDAADEQPLTVVPLFAVLARRVAR